MAEEKKDEKKDEDVEYSFAYDSDDVYDDIYKAEWNDEPDKESGEFDCEAEMHRLQDKMLELTKGMHKLRIEIQRSEIGKAKRTSDDSKLLDSTLRL